MSKQTQTNLNSQYTFLNSLDEQGLHELLCRSYIQNNTPSYLANSILIELQTNHATILTQHKNLQVVSKVKQSNTPHGIDIYMLIEFREEIKNKQETIGHITFHLIPDECTTNTRGPLHVINDRSTRRMRRIYAHKETIQSCNKFTFALSSIEITNFDIKHDLYNLASVSLKVLDRWFDPAHDEYITKTLCQSSAHIDALVKTLMTLRKPSVGKSTYKRGGRISRRYKCNH